MKRLAMGVALFGLLAGGAWMTRPASGQGDKAPTVKEIMGRLNKQGGLYFALGKSLKADAPAWAEIKSQTKEIAQLGACLGKNAPPKGEKDSWETLTKAYADNAQALAQAAERMDKDAAQAAYNKLGGTACAACHKAHRK